MLVDDGWLNGIILQRSISLTSPDLMTLWITDNEGESCRLFVKCINNVHDEKWNRMLLVFDLVGNVFTIRWTKICPMEPVMGRFVSKKMRFLIGAKRLTGVSIIFREF